MGTFIALFLSVPSSFAQSDPIYVPLPGGVKSTLYKPDSGPAPDVAVLTVHRVSNKLSGLECTELSKRGFMVLCLNTRFDNNEAEMLFETMALDVKQGVDFLKKQPGIKISYYGAIVAVGQPPLFIKPLPRTGLPTVRGQIS